MEIETLRAKVLKGEPLSLEETRVVLASIRRGYRAAQAPTKKAPAKKAAASGAKSKSSGATMSDIEDIFS